MGVTRSQPPLSEVAMADVSEPRIENGLRVGASFADRSNTGRGARFDFARTPASTPHSSLSVPGRFRRSALSLRGLCSFGATTRVGGRLLWQCNKWLRWALVEANWSAIQCGGCFGSIYRAARDRGENKNVAITMVAHRLCQIIWLLLTEKRPYTKTAHMKKTAKTFPDRSELQ